ncbi:MAG: AAA family ATPase [Rhodospirillales bacterium]
MTFEFRPARSIDAVRSLLIALAGSSGSGKTFSALRIATGLVDGTGKRIRFIDTEGGRGLHYKDQFDFDYTEIAAPFRPQTYQDAILAAENDPQTGVIVVDSLSHEWEGEGGILEWADEILYSKGTWDDGNPKMKPPAQWKDPKQAHKRFMARMLQCRAHLIFCLRAEEKMLMETQTDNQGRKKTVVIPAKDRPLHERWAPICEKRFMYEMTASFLMIDKTSGGEPGVPTPLKLQEQHKGAFPDGKHISEASGRALAEWAGGGRATAAPSQAASTTGGPPQPDPAPRDNAAAPGPSHDEDSARPRWIFSNGQPQFYDNADAWEDAIAAMIGKASPEQAAEAEARNKDVMAQMAEAQDCFGAVVRVRDLFRKKAAMVTP